jgi:MerR family transcriptional regulator, mercuric resistance operon regulatory protein
MRRCSAQAGPTQGCGRSWPYARTCSGYSFKAFFDMSKAPTELTIGALSEQTGVNVETIRYYEREGLLPSAARTAGGHRVFDEAHLRRLIFIRRSRELGFSGTEVRTLLGLVDGGYTCGEVRDLTLRHIVSVRSKIADLRRLEKTLTTISSKCAGGDTPDCPIVEALSADHPLAPQPSS